MAYSVFQDPQGIDWPLGFVAVAASGTPVSIMVNVDPNNNNAPGTAPTGGPGAKPTIAEYTPRCHKVTFQGIHPAANNNGMVTNAGNVYILRSLGPGNQNSGGPANRTDPGAMVYILYPGAGVTIPAEEYQGATISPYRYTLDVDISGEGALVTLLNCSR
jgi:hypothetical protein